MKDHRIRGSRWLARFGLAVSVAIAAAMSTSAAPAASASAAYAGSETCIECHEDTAESLKTTSHGKAGFTELSSHGCEACHGPAAGHTKNPQDETLRPKISNRPADELNAICQGCHDGGKQMLWTGSQHEKRGLSCISCHSVHSPLSDDAQLKTATQSETCYECHKDVRLEMRKTSHHPVREGKMDCADCHNPHGTASPKLITAATVNDQCYQCHAEKRGPFLWEHAPVREDCTNCHTPHGSNHAKLQRMAVPYLCQQCHSNTRHPGTLYDANALPGQARQSNREFNRGCVNCHASIHGSNHPSGPYLGR